jgi:hypothetical protein
MSIWSWVLKAASSFLKLKKFLEKNSKYRDVALCSIIFTQGRFENVGATVRMRG